MSTSSSKTITLEQRYSNSRPSARFFTRGRRRNGKLTFCAIKRKKEKERKKEKRKRKKKERKKERKKKEI